MSSADASQSTRSNAFNAAYSLVPIEYSIAGGSEHSGRYDASNIKCDKPMDQNSRWSGLQHDRNPRPRQWLLLEMECVSVLYTVTFGKFHKVHPCNLKEFRILAGLTKDHMTEILHANLKNDTVSETFLVRNISNDGIQIPMRYLKIEALSAHGVNYNISVWFVALAGVKDPSLMGDVLSRYDNYRETKAMRHLLKHLRQRRHIATYQKLLNQTGVELEHPLVSQLYESLVLRGDWSLVERLLRAFPDEGLFDYYIHSNRPQAVWTRLIGVDANGDIPSKRGGHSMCMDTERGLIYIFGGYDGQKSLDDFWVYDTKSDRWNMISPSTSEEKNGPGPRACHKMVFDSKSGSIYLLGRLADGDFPSMAGKVETSLVNPPVNPAIAPGSSERAGSDVPVLNAVGQTTHATSARSESMPMDNSSTSPQVRIQVQNFCSEFYRYRTRGLDQGKWELLSFDTAMGGGPPLVYDHQMVIDSDAQMIYVYGGRVVDGDWESIKYSGLYSYDIRASKWSLLPIISTNNEAIPQRFGHSMVFDNKRKCLFIFSGRQAESNLTDMWQYDITTHLATELCSNFTALGGPESYSTQRSVIDPSLKEFYVVDGAIKNDTRSNTPPKAAVYLYHYEKFPGQWTPILPNSDDATNDDLIPQSRSAHQVAYNNRSKTFYMHGGKTGVLIGAPHNGDEGNAYVNVESRLDDLWGMTLKRLPQEEVVRRTILIVRQQQYREIAEDVSPVRALMFLQTEISAVVNHSNQEEVENFRGLLSLLVAPSATNDTSFPVELYYGPSPNPTPLSTPSDDERWTSELPENLSTGAKADAEYSHEDIIHTSKEGETSSATRFRERTEVFEKLLEFLSPEVKQPSENLLDMLDISEDLL